MRSISEVLDQPVVGNAEADAYIWEDVWRIAEDESAPVADRAAAIRHMDVLTGEEQANGDDFDVIKGYMKEMAIYNRRAHSPVNASGRTGGLVVEVVDEHRNHLEPIGGALHITVGEAAIYEEDAMRHLKIEGEGRTHA